MIFVINELDYVISNNNLYLEDGSGSFLALNINQDKFR